MNIDVNHTALLVVDMQKYQAGEGGNLPKSLGLFHGHDAETGAVQRGKELIPIIAKLILAFRAAKGKIVYTAFGSTSKDDSDLVPYVCYWNKRTIAAFGIPTIVSASDPGYAILPELSPMAGEPVINKTAQGAFTSSNIDQVLNQMSVHTLVVTGMYTNNCVLATCIGAADSGFRVYVPADAVGTWSANVHQSALAILSSWVTITSSDQVISALASVIKSA